MKKILRAVVCGSVLFLCAILHPAYAQPTVWPPGENDAPYLRSVALTSPANYTIKLEGCGYYPGSIILLRTPGSSTNLATYSGSNVTINRVASCGVSVPDLGSTRYDTATTSITQAEVRQALNTTGLDVIIANPSRTSGAYEYSATKRLQGAATNTPPTVDWTAPAAGAVFYQGENVYLTVNATDADGSVTRVDFLIDSQVVGSDAGRPYSFRATNLAVGTHTLLAKAYDNSGAVTAAASRSITVRSNQAPVVRLTAPANDATFAAPATLQLAATASDPDGTIAEVKFQRVHLNYGGGYYVDQLGTDTEAPYTLALTNRPAGVYRLRAVATDNRGVSTDSADVYVSVVAPNQSPTVTLMAPVNGAAYPAPATLTLSAQAADADGSVERVDFYSNGSATAIASVPRAAATGAIFQTSWPALTAGRYSITAKAFDNAGGASAVSAAAVVDVTTAAARETVHFYHSDAQGSVVAVSDIAGQRVSSTSYRPFGQIATGTGENSPTRLGFTGKLRDTDLELSYFGARFYDPVYGRFASLDPADFDHDKLALFNRYAHAHNNPFTYSDPDGRLPDFIQHLMGRPVEPANQGYDQVSRLVADSIEGQSESMVANAPSVAMDVGVLVLTAASVVHPGMRGGGVARTAALMTVRTAGRVLMAQGARDRSFGVLLSTESAVFSRSQPWRVHPEVKAQYDAVPDHLRSAYHMKCAEVGCMSEALYAGQSLRGAQSAVIKIRKPGHQDALKFQEACSSCAWVMDRLGVSY